MNAYKTMLAGCVIGLSMASNAGLSLVHYYSYTDIITNDLVGSANGTIAGTAQIVGGALVTDHSFGQLDDGGIAQNSMTLPTNVVEGISNAFSIVTWFQLINGGAIYNTTYSFSTGKDMTGDYLLSSPASYDAGLAARVEVRQDNAAGVDVDNVTYYNGFTALDNGNLHQTVFTYDGATAIAFYVDGVFQSSNTINHALDLSAWDKVGVHGGSPWPDDTSNGTNFVFGIFDQELTSDDVEALYAKGKEVVVPDILVIGDEPFFFHNMSPNGDSVMNDVTLSAEIVDNASEFDSAELYLDNFTSNILDSATTVSGTTTVSSTSMTLAPDSTHTAYLVVTGQTPPAQVTNSWTFTMAPQFDISVSPEVFSLDYNYQPTVSAQLIDLNDELNQVDLYINGTIAASQMGAVTTTVSAVVDGPLDPGTNVTCRIIASGSNGYGPVTNDWTFTMGGGVGVTVWNTNAPPSGGFDIIQTESATIDIGNVSGIADNATGHEWTYVATDRPAEGQTFTTGSSATGYKLSSVWLRATPYNDGGATAPTGSTFKVRITNPSKTNMANFVKSTQVLTNLNGGLAAGDGRWVQFRLETPVVLSPNTQYGFDVGTPGPAYFNTSGVNYGSFAGGAAYRSGDNGAGTTSAELSASGDRTFLVEMDSATEPFSLDDFSPMGSGINNAPTLTAVITELNGTFDDANTKLYLDGIEQSKNATTGSSPTYTVSADLADLAPQSTHTGMVAIASSSPVQTVTNYTYFTMADAFSFTAHEPAQDAFLLTNETALSVQVINAADAYDSAAMYLDGGPDLGPSLSADGPTNTLNVASSGILEPGQHTVTVVVTGALFGDKTNTWDFTVGGGAGVTIWTTNNPTVNADDIYQFEAATIDADNVNGGSDDFTFVANNQPAQGQFFATGTGIGYELSSVWIRHALYDNNTSLGDGAKLTLRITDPSRTGSSGFVVYEEDLPVLNPPLQGPDQKWLQLKLATNVVLNANSQYGFDVASHAGTWSYFETSGVSNDPYNGGDAYNSGAADGYGDNTVSNVPTSDRTFLVELTGGVPYIPANPFIITGTPDGVILTNTFAVEATIVDSNEVLDAASLYVDGVLKSSSYTGSGGTNTISAPSASYSNATSHTAMLITTGMVYPYNLYTNEWSFTVAIDIAMDADNGDFEAGVGNIGGFDSPNDVPGWTDISIADSGVEGGASIWWGTYNNSYSAFMKNGDAAYIMSDGYTILDGDEYVVSYVAKSWSDGSSEWTVTLFYDDPANVIGSYSHSTDGTWREGMSTTIAATPASVGGTLGVSFANSGSQFANLDEVKILLVKEGVGPVVGPTLSLSIPVGGPITISWPESFGMGFIVLTNDDLVNSNGWSNANLTPFNEGGGIITVTNAIGSEPQLFYKLSD